jgi:thymidylate kinase
VIVVFLGPDGCGKSSVIEQLQSRLSGKFPILEVFHLRPRWGRGGVRQGPPVVDPHNLPPRSATLSFVKLVYLALDYNLVNLWRCLDWATRSPRLIIFDRYYHDILVDPRRYRYGAPMWLARWFARLVPTPDLWIVLDAPADVIHLRKQEVSLAETARQCQAFRRLVDGFPNAHVVDATVPMDGVVRSAEALILARASGAAPAG